MKINSLSLEVQDKMQDKYQKYIRYIRRVVQIYVNTVAHSTAERRLMDLRERFKKWKELTGSLGGIKE